MSVKFKNIFHKILRRIKNEKNIEEQNFFARDAKEVANDLLANSFAVKTEMKSI